MGIIQKRAERNGYRRLLNSRPNVFPPGFTEGDSSLFHCCPEWLNLWKSKDKHEAGDDLRQKNQQKKPSVLTAVGAAWTHSVWAVSPGNRPVHHPGDACLLASMCQHLTNSLTRCHTACGSELLLHCPLLGWTGKHRDRRSAGEHLCRHMVLGARKLQPETMCAEKKYRRLNA